jgi:hypothetical protein
MKRTLIAAALAVATLASAHASAASINGLVNTGVGAAGTQDSNYALTSNSSDTTIASGYGYVTGGTGFPFDYWTANDATSKWITPTAIQGQSFDANANGTYTYELTFNLAGDVASTAAFTGRFSADNSAVVTLNGQTIGSSGGFTSWSGFSANSGFNSGLNTLDFTVTNWAQNGGNPTGLRVEFTSSNVTAVPEPDGYAMLLAGMGLVGFMARRRKAK